MTRFKEHTGPGQGIEWARVDSHGRRVLAVFDDESHQHIEIHLSGAQFRALTIGFAAAVLEGDSEALRAVAEALDAPEVCWRTAPHMPSPEGR